MWPNVHSRLCADVSTAEWQMLRELRTSLRENSMVIDNLEEAVEDEQPVLFSEYLSGTDAERANLDVGVPTLIAYL